MSRRDLSILTPDGNARAFLFTPSEGVGPWPAVLFFMDGLAIRPTLFDMAQRLADAGYSVLLPDMFWRLGPYEPLVPAEVVADPQVMKQTFERLFASTDPVKSMIDTAAFLEWLDSEPSADTTRVGAIGYCMGGGMALRAAATFPDRIAAAAAFHPGGLVTDAPDSIHRLVPQIRAKVLVAGADQDPHFEESDCAALDRALREGGVEGQVTIYRGALHGFAPPDCPTYDQAASERHWSELLALFAETLG